MFSRLLYHHRLKLLLPVLMIPLLWGCAGKKTEKSDLFFDEWKTKAENARGHSPSGSHVDLEPTKAASSVSPETPLLVKPPEEKEPPEKAPVIKRSLPKVPVSLTMRDVELPVLIRALARAADVNILVSRNVKGKAVINIRKSPWDQVFLGLLETYGYTYLWSGNIIRVVTLEDMKKNAELSLFEQKMASQKRENDLKLLSLQKKIRQEEPLVTKIVHIDYADPVTLRDNLAAFLAAGDNETPSSLSVSEEGEAVSEKCDRNRSTILVDAHTNSLMIQAKKNDMDRLLPLIKTLDRPTPQVLIEAHIVETTSDTARELGVQWGGLRGGDIDTDSNTWIGGPIGSFDESLVTTEDTTDAAGNVIPAGTPVVHVPSIGNIINLPASNVIKDGVGMSLGLTYEKVGEHILTMQLTALQQEGKLNILSSPSITTLDNQTAIIESGKDVPFQTVEDDEVKIEFKKAVLSLEVTPHVIDGKTIKLEIKTHKDELDFTNTVAGNPTIITKNAETGIVLFNGQSTVIGGLSKEVKTESESGVPWLMNLPGLGHLFKTTGKGRDMEEVLIFITPHILPELKTEQR